MGREPAAAPANERFAHWLARSDLSNKELARRVRARAHAKGLTHVSTEASRIRGWLSGQQPAEEVAELVAEVVTVACGQPVRPTDLGFARAGGRREPVVDLSEPLPSVIRRLESFTRSDLLGGASDGSGTEQMLRGAELTAPLQVWEMFPATRGKRATDPSRHVVSAFDCEQMEAATQIFRLWDNSNGGGLRRKAVVGQLTEMSELLSGPFDGEQVERRFFAGVADLAQLAGWMSFDVGLHTKAQNYFSRGLQMAKHSGDQLQGARMLYCLARQSMEVGRPQDALEILEIALHGIRRRPDTRVNTLLLGMKAQAAVSVPSPDIWRSERDIAEAIHIYSKPVDEDCTPRWVSFYDDAELAGVLGSYYVLLSMGDPVNQKSHASKGVRWANEAVRLRHATYNRSKVLDLNNLARAYLLQGEPKQAAETAESAAELSRKVQSGRVRRRFSRTARLAQDLYPSLYREQGIFQIDGVANVKG